MVRQPPCGAVMVFPEGRAADNRAVYLTYLGNKWLR
jgi:hypothetical protein